MRFKNWSDIPSIGSIPRSVAALCHMAGATISDRRNASTGSYYYIITRVDGMSVTIRDANHAIVNPWSGCGVVPLVDPGATINIGDTGRQRGLQLLAVFLGYPADRVKVADLNTLRGINSLTPGGDP